MSTRWSGPIRGLHAEYLRRGLGSGETNTKKLPFVLPERRVDPRTSLHLWRWRQNVCFRNIDIYLRAHTVLQPRRPGWRKWSWPNLRYYPGICVEGEGNPRKNVSQGSRSLGRNLNPGPPEYEPGVPTTQLLCCSAFHKRICCNTIHVIIQSCNVSKLWRCHHNLASYGKVNCSVAFLLNRKTCQKMA
jgi:hypothetical protein